MERSATDTDSIQCHPSEIHGERCVWERADLSFDRKRMSDACLTIVNCLEWLNGLVRLVVQGSYDKLFSENPPLREFLTRNADDPHSTAIKTQLNNDPEFVWRTSSRSLNLVSSFERSIDLLRTLIGIAYLQLFVINNFVGPRTVLTNSEPAASTVEIFPSCIDRRWKFSFRTVCRKC